MAFKSVFIYSYVRDSKLLIPYLDHSSRTQTAVVSILRRESIAHEALQSSLTEMDIFLIKEKQNSKTVTSMVNISILTILGCR